MSAVLAGLALGAVFGAAARAGAFCLLRGLKGLFGGGDLSPLRAFALALAVAIIGSQSLNYLGLTDFSRALPLRGQVPAGGLAIGGAIFGLGMVMANACGARSLVLLAGGNLRSLLVLLCLGVSAQASLTGILSPLRSALQIGPLSPAAIDLPGLIAPLGLSEELRLVILCTLLCLILFAFSAPLLRQRPIEAALAVIIGLCITAGWYLAMASEDPFDPKVLNSVSFIAPTAESLLWLMLASGRAAGFTTGLVGGTIAGAFVLAVLSRSFTFETFTSGGHSLKAAFGGILMGFGGVLALGCSIGQGLSGLSTLSIASLIAMAGLIGGAMVGLILFPPGKS